MIRKVTYDTVLANPDWAPDGLGAANQDPGVFTSPRVVDIERSPNPHLAFGAGIHHCLGAALARTEAAAASGGLARHFPHIELSNSARTPVR